MMTRLGVRRWHFRAELPDASAQAAFQFSSGVTVAMNVGGGARGKPQAKDTTAKPFSAWGTPLPKHRPQEAEVPPAPRPADAALANEASAAKRE
eukprot:5877780-Pyramimonas_sp.AAC.1